MLEAVAEATEVVRARIRVEREHQRRERLGKCLRFGIEADVHATFQRQEPFVRKYPGLSTVEARYLQGCCKHLKIGVTVKPGKDWGKPFTLKQLRRLRACVASNWRKRWAKARKEKEIE